MPAPSPVLASAPGGAAVVEVAQRGEALLDDVVAARGPCMSTTKRDAAGVVLEARVVEALACREVGHSCS